MFPGYALISEKTHEYFFKDYFCTGDIGYMDEDGYFYYYRRKKDLIIRGGLNIHPDEINAVLNTHPEVKTCQTSSIPDPFFGEQIRACVVLRDGRQTVGEAELKAYCQKRLSPIKVPDFIVIQNKQRDASKANQEKPI